LSTPVELLRELIRSGRLNWSQEDASVANAVLYLAENATVNGVESVNTKTGAVTIAAYDGSIGVDNSVAGTVKLQSLGVSSSTGVLISKSGAPSAGDGSDGQYCLDTKTGYIWGPKSAGAWPAAPIILRDSDGFVRGEALGTITRASTDCASAINSALDTYHFIALEGDADWSFPNDYRIASPIHLNDYDGLRGHNTTVLALEWDGSRRPMVSWEIAQAVVGLGDPKRSVISGLRVDGYRGQSGRNGNNDDITGFHFGGRGTNSDSGDYDTTLTRIHSYDLTAVRCYVAFDLHATQYALHEDLHAMSGNVVGFVLRGSRDGAGNVDQLTYRYMMARGAGVGFLTIANNIGPLHNNQNQYGCWGRYTTVFGADVWEPTDAVGDQEHNDFIGAEMRDFTTEFNGGNAGGMTEFGSGAGNGTSGEDSTVAVTVTSTHSTDADTTETYTIPAVEWYVEKNFHRILRNGAFQSVNSKIIALVDGPGAVIELDNVSYPEQCPMIVRARDKDAFCDLHDLRVLGGAFENVRRWPDFARSVRGAYVPTASGYQTTLCGYGDREKIESNPLHFGSYLHAGISRANGDWSGTSNANVTTGTDTDPETGETVGYFEFSSSAVQGDRAQSPFLNNGGASATNFSDASGMRVEMISLHNKHASQAIRIVPHLRNASGFVSGCQTSLINATVPQAVTLWPGRWMTVCIIHNSASDCRFAVDLQDDVGVAVRVLSRFPAAFRVPYYRFPTLHKVIARRLWAA
jgi:hypothetical protein